MSTTPGESSTVRVGDAERQAAIAQLRSQWQAGRLDPTEHEARTTKAYAAVTRGDLDALFNDLPPASVAPAVAGGVGGSVEASAPEVPIKGVSNPVPSRSWIRAHREQVIAVTPFVALACFFIFHSWLFFLLIPAMGALLFAGDDGGDKARRHRDRDERRRIERGE